MQSDKGEFVWREDATSLLNAVCCSFFFLQILCLTAWLVAHSQRRQMLGFWWETRGSLSILSMQALMRSHLVYGGGTAATPHQPSRVDQGVKILAIGLQQKSKQCILRGEKIYPKIWHNSVFPCPMWPLLHQKCDKQIHHRLICKCNETQGKGIDKGKISEHFIRCLKIKVKYIIVSRWLFSIVHSLIRFGDFFWQIKDFWAVILRFSSVFG